MLSDKKHRTVASHTKELRHQYPRVTSLTMRQPPTSRKLFALTIHCWSAKLCHCLSRLQGHCSLPDNTLDMSSQTCSLNKSSCTRTAIVARELETVWSSMYFRKWTNALGYKMVVMAYLDPPPKVIAQRFRCDRATHSRQLSKYLIREHV